MMIISGCCNKPGPTPDGKSVLFPRLSPPCLPRPVRGVLFDMCNVLYDDTLWRRWLLRLLSQLGVQTNYQCFFHLWDREYLDAVHRGQTTFCAAFESFLRSIGMSRGQIEEVQAASQSKRRSIEESLHALPGVKTALAQIAGQGRILGAICNSELTAIGLRDRLSRLGLAPWFSFAVSSMDLGKTMPDAECYQAALKTMALPPDAVAFVGHNAADLSGAAAVGMTTIAFNFDPNVQADAYLNRIEELPSLILNTNTPLAAAG